MRKLLLALALLPLLAHAGETEIDALLSAANVSDKTPGAAVLVIQDGKKVFEKGYGLAHVKPEQRIGPRTVFELASCSKQFTAMAIMMLAERGKLSYDDKLSKSFPEFAAFGNQITVEHLLHHTSGLPDYMEAFGKSRARGDATSAEMRRLLAKETKLRFMPGEKYEYSNSGYMILAQIVEKASDKKYPAFMTENIFVPLAMGDTFVFDETKPKALNEALCYEKDGAGWKNISEHPLNTVYGDGSVRSTLEDLFKWDQALYTEKLVKAATLERAFTSGKLSDGKSTGYGYGWGTGEFGGTRVVSHAGAWLGFHTSIVRLPEKRLSVIVLSNMAKFDANGMAMKIARMYLKGMK